MYPKYLCPCKRPCRLIVNTSFSVGKKNNKIYQFRGNERIFSKVRRYEVINNCRLDWRVLLKVSKFEEN